MIVANSDSVRVQAHDMLKGFVGLRPKAITAMPSIDCRRWGGCSQVPLLPGHGCSGFVVLSWRLTVLKEEGFSALQVRTVCWFMPSDFNVQTFRCNPQDDFREVSTSENYRP